MRPLQLRIGQLRVAVHKPDLVERKRPGDFDGKRPGDDLQVHRTGIPRRNLIETRAVVDDDSGEDVQTADRALGVRSRPNALRQIQSLQQRDEVGTVLLQHGAAIQWYRWTELIVGYAAGYQSVAGKEAASEPVGPRAQSQVEAGRLNALIGNSIVSGDPTTLDSRPPRAVRKNSRFSYSVGLSHWCTSNIIEASRSINQPCSGCL